MNNERIIIDENVFLDFLNDKIAISIKGYNRFAFVDYTDDLLEIIKKARFRIPKPGKKTEKYPYSNEYKKTLHQIVFDYYFGEETRKKLYDAGYIIEHLDNDGLNCVISNLFVLKEIKNYIKGIHFDKLARKSLPIIALSIYHILENKTFQITIAFNTSFIDKYGRQLDNIKLLYPYNYEIVLQDAEQILESIVHSKTINLAEWKNLYRFVDYRVNYYSEVIELTDEEKALPFGSVISRNGKSCMIVGSSKNNGIGRIIKIPYDKDWNIKTD